PYADTLLCTGDSIVLSPGDFDTYLWQDGSAKNNFVVHHGGTYSVTVTNRCGMATRKMIIDERVCTIMFPSAFTPNHDGINDIFNILNAYSLVYYHCIIYNRWGQKVFETTNPKNGWDGMFKGAAAPSGVYAWSCDYTRMGNAGKTHLKGIVTLLK
ncbi:MAG: gliding motility-associated C-terminal domain-containing protein, partial [Bacteroidota bacterium]|nr:gliding motility-associated C-terminal domain-containing protein [Bacteroidota bacterium]